MDLDAQVARPERRRSIHRRVEGKSADVHGGHPQEEVRHHRVPGDRHPDNVMGADPMFRAEDLSQPVDRILNDQVLQLLQGEVYDRQEVPVLDAMRKFITRVEESESGAFAQSLDPNIDIHKLELAV